MNISKLRASVADAQRQGAPDNAMISIPIGELDQALEEVEALEGQRNALDVRLPQNEEKQLRDALRELEAHRDELAANLRSVEAIAEAAKRDLREAELKRDYWRKDADTNQETARQLAIDLEAAEKSADLWQRQCQQAREQREHLREQREAHRELVWRVVNLRAHGAGAAGAMYDLAARLHDPDWRPAWDHNGDGEISDNAELVAYTDQAGQKRSAWDPSVQGFRIRVTDDYETVEVDPITDNAELDAYTKNAEEAFGLKPQSDQWSDPLEQRLAEFEQRLGNVEAHVGMSYSEGDLAELFGTTDEEEQDR